MSPIRMIFFLSMVTIVLSAISYFTAHKLLMTSPWLLERKAYVWSAVVAFVFLQILGPIQYRIFPARETWGFVFQWITYTTLGLVACLFFYALVVELVARLGNLISDTSLVVLERRALFGASLFSLLSVVKGIQTAHDGLVVEKITVPIKDLPEELIGFTIAQISDLHVGPTIGRAYAEKVVALTNALSPQLIALTGDFVDGTPEVLRPHLEPLKNFKARYGVFFCPGNHEYYWNVTRWLSEFSSMGFQTLVDEHKVIQVGMAQIAVGGVADYSASQVEPHHESNAVKAFSGAPSDAIRLLLAHQPRSYRTAKEAGTHLQLSGHTHAGQFFPFSIVVALTQKYYKGLNNHEGMWIYTNRGTGYWGPPVRFTVPPEISCITLQRA